MKRILNFKKLLMVATVIPLSLATTISCGTYIIRSQEQIVLNQPLRLAAQTKWSEQHQQWQYELPSDQSGKQIVFNGSISDFLIWLLSLNQQPIAINQLKILVQNLINQGFMQAANQVENLANRVESQLFGQMVNNNFYWHWKELLNYQTSALEVYWQDFSGLQIRQNQGENNLEAIMNRFWKADQLPDASDFDRLLQVNWASDYFIWFKLDLVASARWNIMGKQQQSVEFVFHIKPDYDPQWNGSQDQIQWQDRPLSLIKQQSSFIELATNQALAINQTYQDRNDIKAIKNLKWMQDWFNRAYDSVLEQDLNQANLDLIKSLKNEFLWKWFNEIATKGQQLPVSLETMETVLAPLVKHQQLSNLLNLKIRIKINDLNSNWTTLINNQAKWDQGAKDVIKQVRLLMLDWNWNQPITITNDLSFEWQIGKIQYRQNQVGLTYLNQNFGIDQENQPIAIPTITYLPFFSLFSNYQADQNGTKLLDSNLLTWIQIIKKGTYEN